jgi:hypothetical protein
MPTTIIALKILLLLLPGFLTLWIQESLGEKKERYQIDKIALIFLYDIFIFGIYLGTLKLIPSIKPFILDIQEKNIDIIRLSFYSLILFLIISILLGILFALFNIYSWHYILLRKLKITYKTGRSTVWNDVFYERQGYYVIVHLEEGIRIFGWASDFSTDPGPKYLFISDAKYLGTSTKKDVEIKGPGILITNESKIKYIEFLTPD